MTTKLILTIFGVLVALQGFGLFIGAEAATLHVFAIMNPTETGIAIGTRMHEVVGIVNINIALILLFSRNLPPSSGAKVLSGASFGLAIVFAQALYHLLATENKPPFQLLIIMATMVIIGFITVAKAKTPESS